MKAKLKTLKRGQTFYGAGIQWLVLGHTNSSQGLPIVTHIVSTGIVERRAFDEKNRNDLGVSTLLAMRGGYTTEKPNEGERPCRERTDRHPTKKTR